MVEKADRPKQASGRSQAGKTARPAAKRAAKKSARKSGKTAAAVRKPKVQKPAAGKRRKGAAEAAIENLAVSKEELAARRVAGGRNTGAAVSSAPENQHPNGPQAPAAGIDGGAAATPVSAPVAVPSDPAPAEGKPEAAGRVPEIGKRGKTEPRSRAAENAEGGSRPTPWCRPTAFM